MENFMNTIKLAGILCIAAGIAGLLYGSFSYTKDTEVIKLGPVELSVKEQKTVNVPMWAVVVAMVVGGALLLLGTRKS